MIRKFDLLINNRPVTVTADPAMPLLWVLRDLLDLTGTKFGCGMGLCGACTVHLAGVATRSCQVPVLSVGDRPVTTIEGLGAGAEHVVQSAWIAKDVPQCGYCQPGQIMAAAQSGRPPSTTALEGNLCRCGTYSRIRAAIATLRASGDAP